MFSAPDTFDSLSTHFDKSQEGTTCCCVKQDDPELYARLGVCQAMLQAFQTTSVDKRI